MASSELNYEPVDSPCVGVCTVDDRGLCVGCHRTVKEICTWLEMSQEERRHIMQALQHRALEPEPR